MCRLSTGQDTVSQAHGSTATTAAIAAATAAIAAATAAVAAPSGKPAAAADPSAARRPGPAGGGAAVSTVPAPAGGGVFGKLAADFGKLFGVQSG